MKIQKDPFKYAISVSAIIIALSIAYYLIVFIPKQANIKLEQTTLERLNQQDIATQRKNDYLACIYLAETMHTSWWNSSCKNFGINKKTDGCTLPKYNADQINDKRDKDTQNCITLYK